MSQQLKVTAIAAMTRDRVIGTGQGIPWNLPEDHAHFRAYTAGKTLLIGRTTFQEMLGWFSDHRPIVLTSNPSYQNPAAAAVVASVDEAVSIATGWSASELVVCGGATTYTAALPHTTDAILTEIDASFPGKARFPELLASEWEIKSNTGYPASSTSRMNYSIVHYTRR